VTHRDVTEDSGSGLLARARRLISTRAVRFILVGGFNSVFAYALFAALTLGTGAHIHYLVVLVVSTVISILEAYVMQRLVVWRVLGRWWRELVRFSGVYFVVLIVNAILLPVLHEFLGVPVLTAQALIMVVNAFGTFAIHRSFTFRKSLDGS
jgi:putative flippase GtrA